MITDEIKSTFVPFSPNDIERLAGAKPFERGKGYMRAGNISGAVLRDTILTADCEGSQEEPYALILTLVPSGQTSADGPETPAQAVSKTPTSLWGGEQTAAGIADYSCDCEAGGFCKHLVALALTWLDDSETIEVRPTFAQQLQHASREQLLTLCVRLLKQQPEMEYLIDLLAPTPQSEAISSEAISSVPSTENEAREIPLSPLANRVTVDLNPIRRKIQKAFRHSARDYDDYDYEGDPTEEIAEEIEPFYEMAVGYHQAGQWANSIAVYTTIITEIQDANEDESDDSALDSMVADCATGLVYCLEGQNSLPESYRLSPESRKELLEFLFEGWGNGQIDVDNEARIAQAITQSERSDIEARLRETLSERKMSISDWGKRRWLAFLLTLREQSGITNDERLAEYQRYSLWQETTGLLLEMGRVEEAIGLAQDKLDFMAFTTFADRLLAMGGEHVERALALVAERERALEQSAAPAPLDRINRHYLEWLGARYAAHDRPAEALAIRIQHFATEPGADTYRKVHEAAILPGNPPDSWETLRPQLIATLEAADRWYQLITLYLEEKEARAALDALQRQEREKRQGGYSPDMGIPVAQLAEASYPEEAIRLYQREAENQIASRGRTHYQAAARHLVRVRDLYTRLNQQARWQTYITSLKDTNRALRALHDELRTLKLIT